MIKLTFPIYYQTLANNPTYKAKYSNKSPHILFLLNYLNLSSKIFILFLSLSSIRLYVSLKHLSMSYITPIKNIIKNINIFNQIVFTISYFLNICIIVINQIPHVINHKQPSINIGWKPSIYLSFRKVLTSCISWFKIATSLDKDQSSPAIPPITKIINDPTIYPSLLLKKSSFNSFTFVMKEFSRIFVYSEAVFSSNPVARYSLYTFKVSICDISRLLKLVDKTSSFILFILCHGILNVKKKILGVYTRGH